MRFAWLKLLIATAVRDVSARIGKPIARLHSKLSVADSLAEKEHWSPHPKLNQWQKPNCWQLRKPFLSHYIDKLHLGIHLA